MSDERALLAAIRDHPEEDTPRLVYADWLDEGGGEANAARAELIRVQCETHRVRGARNHAAPRFKQLESRAAALVAKYAGAWLADFPVVPPEDDTFARGFLRSLTLSASKCSGPPPPWHREPFVEVELTGTAKALRKPFAEGWFDGVAGLDLKPARASGADALAEAVAGSSCARTLRALSLWGEGYGDRALRAVARGGFGELRHLSCMGQFTPDGWHTVLDSPAADRLEDLTIGHRAPWQTADQNRPGPALADVLTSAPRLAGLRRLWVNACGLTDAGVARLARGRFPALARLSIDNNPFGEAGMRALGAADFPALRELAMSSCGLTDDVIEVLTRAPLLDRLENLSLTLNRLTAAGARAVATCGRTARLKYLDLGCNRLGDEGVKYLMRSANFPALEELHLSTTEMTDAGADAVYETPWAERLQTLFMSYNRITKRKQKELTAKFGDALWISGVVDE